MATKLRNKSWLFYLCLLLPSGLLCGALLYGDMMPEVFDAYGRYEYFTGDGFTKLLLFSASFLAVFLFLLFFFRGISLLLPPEICLLLLVPLVREYAAYGIPADWYNMMVWGGWSAPAGPCAAFLFLLSFSYLAAAGLAGLLLVLWRRDIKRYSLLYRLVRFLGRRQSLRRRFLLEILFAFLDTALFTFLLWMLLPVIFDHNSTLFLLISLPIVFYTAVLLLLFARKRSASGEIETATALIADLSDGDFLKENPFSPGSPLFETGENLVHIGKITEEGIQKGIAGERLKVELITNVSHDLRTPLTSIIGYSEQLCSMDLPGEAGACAKRLTEKSGYLYRLVEDLFDLSKAASGNAVLEKKEMDLRRLLEQTLGEMNDKILESGFCFKKQLPGEPLLVSTDGFRMHRVFQNLFDNALKYALPGTRIYITAFSEGPRAVVSVMNTASYDMDFHGADITERFVRGDASRTGEGSGLGLAIAKTYTEACGGTFETVIRGDQFEAIVTLPAL